MLVEFNSKKIAAGPNRSVFSHVMKVQAVRFTISVSSNAVPLNGKVVHGKCFINIGGITRAGLYGANADVSEFLY